MTHVVMPGSCLRETVVVALLFLKGAGPLCLCLLCMLIAASNLAVGVASVSNTVPVLLHGFVLSNKCYSCLLHLAAMRSLRTFSRRHEAGGGLAVV
jgi:hypothetical protein